jgi:hypothetical protein
MKNIGNGIDYRPNYRLILKEIEEHGDEKMRMKGFKLYKKLEKKFNQKGYQFSLDESETYYKSTP